MFAASPVTRNLTNNNTRSVYKRVLPSGTSSVRLISPTTLIVGYTILKRSFAKHVTIIIEYYQTFW